VKLDDIRILKSAKVDILADGSLDAHSKTEFKTIRYGIQQAPRAGIEKTSVLNCKPLQQLLALFHR
jgi:histidinol phosphatase-like PHP family hydrolase